MLESEVAETLMSLSAPDERKFASPLYAEGGLPWHAAPDAMALAAGASKKRSFNSSFDTAQTMASSLPNASFMPLAALAGASSFAGSSSFADLARKVQERPLTSLIPRRHRGDHDDDDDDDSDVDMDMDSSSPDEDHERWSRYRSPFDGLVAAARDQEESYSSSSSSNTKPIMIPRAAGGGFNSSRFGDGFSGSYGKKQKWGGSSSLSRVREDGAFSTSVDSHTTHDSSPTGVEDDEEPAWFDPEYKQRMRLASICSSEAGSEYGGLGRQHLEEFIRMEISAANENEPLHGNFRHSDGGLSMSPSRSPPSGEGKYIGSYSPEARRKRIERFLEKRKRRVWAKKVDYDVRKNFANSRLRVKGRFVKKEDEELLCHLLSFT